MSLKAFHIVFVVVATLFLALFAGWELVDYRKTSSRQSLVLGVISLIAALVMIWYGQWFLKKLKRISYL